MNIEYMGEYKNYKYVIVKYAKPASIWRDIAEGSGSSIYYYCGYVELKNTSKYYGKFYDDVPINCHGGLTFSGSKFDEGHCIGFDCNHFGDRIEIQNLDFCINECKSIIDQLIVLENGGLN